VVLLAIIIGVLNSDKPFVNELLVDHLLSRFKTGVLCLELTQENNRIVAYGELPSDIIQGSELKPSKANKICNNILIVNDKDALFSGFLRGTIGIGETYFRKEWTFDPKKYDLGDIVTHIFWNVLNNAGPYTGYLAYLSKNEWKEYFFAKGVMKEQSQDMEDVCYTYFDYRFFEVMLDDTMQYTCSLYNNSIDNLYDAQINKADTLTYKLNLFRDLDQDKTINVLDVGGGWGSLANHINEKGKQFNVTGITISRDQYAYAQKRFGSSNGGQDGKPTYYLMDFRDLPKHYEPGHFKRIISIGVISHIHIRRLDEWFNILYSMLDYDGYFVMQGIVGTTAFANGDKRWLDARYACQTNNFIYKYIFPGGCVLLSDWMHESAIKAGFIVMHRDFIGQHYSKTLRDWRFNIDKEKKYLLENDIVTEKKYLSHEMYLAQAEALYRTGKIEKTQFVFYKPPKDKIHSLKFETWGDKVNLPWQGFGYDDSFPYGSKNDPNRAK